MPQVAMLRIGLLKMSIAASIVAVFIAIGGCDGPRTTLSGESQSPDGKMIARAYVLQTSGIGTGDFGTQVYLNWTHGSQAQAIILSFDDGTDSPEKMNLSMNWISSTHLELAYKGPRSINFQAVKCRGVDISLRDVSNTQDTDAAPPPQAEQNVEAKKRRGKD